MTFAGKKESIGNLSEVVYGFAWRAMPIWDCPYALAIAPAIAPGVPSILNRRHPYRLCSYR